MNYQETLEYLYKRLPMYQRKGKAAYKSDIGNIVSVSKYLDNPHTKFKSIHIAGTNGKGSTAHMLSSILQEAGYTIGLYTSPHLKDFRERIKINGIMISKNQVVEFVKANKMMIEKINLSFFELTVALAFYYFAEQKINIAIIETGLGGRLDSTNIINPELSIITNIGLDHEDLLGNTIEKIAKEKAGIIKRKTTIIIGRKQKETKVTFNSFARVNDAEIIYAENSKYYDTDLEGDYQEENRNTSLTAIRALQDKGWEISEKSIKDGLRNVIRNTSLMGRWQYLSKDPNIICDTGHNKDGITKICRQLKQIKYSQLHFIFGTVIEKDINSILTLLPKDAIYYFCKANIERAMCEKKLLAKASKQQLLGNSYYSVQKAFQKAKKNAMKDDLIFVGGSTFVVAEVL